MVGDLEAAPTPGQFVQPACRAEADFVSDWRQLPQDALHVRKEMVDAAHVSQGL